MQVAVLVGCFVKTWMHSDLRGIVDVGGGAVVGAGEVAGADVGVQPLIDLHEGVSEIPPTREHASQLDVKVRVAMVIGFAPVVDGIAV